MAIASRQKLTRHTCGVPLDLNGKQGIIRSEHFIQIGVQFSIGRGRCSAVFLCECGRKFVSQVYQARPGGQVSCGCLKPTPSGPRGGHGETAGYGPTAEYAAWLRIKRRCHNVADKAYDRYGGRGIFVCDRWLESFSNFLEDMGRKPSGRYSIDRINNDGPYAPGNCRWATDVEQSNNRRCNVFLNVFGETKTCAQWARDPRCVISNHRIIWARVKMGWSDEDAILVVPRSTEARRAAGRRMSLTCKAKRAILGREDEAGSLGITIHPRGSHECQ